MTAAEDTAQSPARGWSQVDIAGKSADVFVPESATPPQRAVLFLHGHGQITLKDNAVYTRELERLGLFAVCPYGKRSWWGDRICQEFDAELSPMAHLRENVVPYLAERWGIRPPAIGLLGVDMGGQGVLKLAYRAAREFPVVVALAPAIDFQNLYGRGLPLDAMYDSCESARQDTAILQLHPLAWPRHQLLVCDPTDRDWFDGVDRLASKLSSTGIPFESEFRTVHGGHSWEYFNHMAGKVLQFLDSRLKQECGP